MPSATRREPAIVAPLVARPPAWVEALFVTPPRPVDVAGRVTMRSSDGFTLFSTSLSAAREMTVSLLREGVARAYADLAEAVTAQGCHPIRFWNFVPSPNDVMGPGLDRYMVFNAGRFDAYVRWYGTPRAFVSTLATASAVGVDSGDLTVACLAADAPGTPVENPRQTPSWEYSTRFGPKPPCFARATIVRIGGERRLLIGGTASIVGEDSTHIGDLEGQTVEALTNLAALIGAACRRTEPTLRDLSRLTGVRVYLARHQDAPRVESIFRQLCPAVTDVETALAQICRPELLVEIEGVASIDPSAD